MTASIWGSGTVLNANVSGSIVPQSFVGSAGQTLFTLTNFTYTPGTGSLQVYINGSLQISGRDYTETSSTSFILLQGVIVGDFIDVLGLPNTQLVAQTAAGTTTSISSTGASIRLQSSKNQDWISALDFIGVDPTGASSSTAGALLAAQSGRTIYWPDGIYLFSTAVVYTGTIRWFGNGKGTVFRADGEFLTISSGSDSFIDNIELQAITPPWVIIRDPANWGANRLGTLVQSLASGGYQPTSSDPEYAAMTVAQQNSFIGPVIRFRLDSININVSRITGNFANINIQDSSYSSVTSCRIRGGHTTWGTIVFDNQSNGVKQGIGNCADGNVIWNSSNNGVFFSNNADGGATNNQIHDCGESGIKTGQNAGYYCYRMKINNNRCWNNYYDNIDAFSSYPPLPTIATYHELHDNYCFNAGHSGLNTDGQFNSVKNNVISGSYTYGISGNCDYSSISSNRLYNNNTVRNATYHDIVVNCAAGDNVVENNYIYGAAGQNNNALYCYVAGIPNTVRNNIAAGNAGIIYAGNVNTISGVFEGNVDTTVGRQSNTCFVLSLLISGTLTHVISGDANSAIGGFYLSKINAATSGFTTTPQGADAATAFAGGAKLSSAATNKIIFDTANQSASATQFIATIISNSSTVALVCSASMQSINVNGVTRNRLCLTFTNATTGVAYNLATMSGQISVQLFGKLA